MRAQTSVEYLILLAALLAVIVPFAFIAQQTIENSSRTSQAKIAADTLADAANSLFLQGPGASTQVQVYLPPSYNELFSYASNRTININIYLATGENSDIFRTTNGEIRGKLPSNGGFQIIPLYYTHAGYVVIGEKKLLVEPPFISETLYPNQISNHTLTVTNIDTSNVTNITLFSNVPWIFLNQTSLGTLLPGESKNITVTLNASGNMSGLYETQILVYENGTLEDNVYITLFVLRALSRIIVTTDKFIYRHNETVYFTINATDYLGNGYPGYGYLHVLYPNGTDSDYGQGFNTNIYGIANGSFVPEIGEPNGIWILNATIDELYNTTNILVRTKEHYLYFENATTVERGNAITSTSYLDVLDNNTYDISSATVYSNESNAYLTSLRAYGAVPDPMDQNTAGYWGVVFANPTNNNITITTVEIRTTSSSYQLFSAVTGVKPTTGWNRVNNRVIRWSGSMLVENYSAVDFIASITGNNRAVNPGNIQLYVALSNGTSYLFTGYSTKKIRNANAAYAGLYFVDANATLFYSLNSNLSKQFTVRVNESSNKASIRAGTQLLIKIPVGWKNITAQSQTGWNNISITGNSSIGWNITANMSNNLQNNYLDFIFNATPPTNALPSLYLFNASLNGTESGQNWVVRSVAECIVKMNYTYPFNLPGLSVIHKSEYINETADIIENLTINNTLFSSTSKNYYMDIWNFNSTSWQNINSGLISNTPVSWSYSISNSTSNISHYLNNSDNTVLIRIYSNDTGNYILSEDYLVYDVYG